MMKKIIAILIILSCMLIAEAIAQDIQFSQYYSAPLFLNPALTGITQSGRVGINYRSQWSVINAGFETFSVYADNNFDEKNSSIGLMFTNDRADLGLASNELALQYAYQVKINYKWVFRPAFQLSYTVRNLDFSKLVFPDQLGSNGLLGTPTNEPINANLNVNYFDVGLGGVVFSRRLWFGVAMHHIRQPNQSLYGDYSPLPRKLSIHGGYQIPLRTRYQKGETTAGAKRAISPTFNYREQAKFNQLDVGIYFTWEPIIFGVWYRGIPVKQPEGGGANNESVILMVGLTQKKMTIGYSFDYTLSGLGISSGGAHEVSLIYSFQWGGPNKPSRSVRELQCPLPMVF